MDEIILAVPADKERGEKRKATEREMIFPECVKGTKIWGSLDSPYVAASRERGPWTQWFQSLQGQRAPKRREAAATGLRGLCLVV